VRELNQQLAVPKLEPCHGLRIVGAASPVDRDRAVRMAVALREGMSSQIASWGKQGHDLNFGVGITLGYATIGQIGFEGRVDYGVIGSVVNLASRLCDEARAGQILMSQRAYAGAEDLIEAERLPDFTLKGIAKPVPAYNVVRLKDDAAS
jgi:adenylate cyclase